MREIKFRVWSKKSKSWHPYPSCLAIRVTDGKLVTAVSDKRLDTVSDEFEYQQLTGLLDIKGKEICEGDIVSVEGKNRVVVYREPSFYLAPNLQEDYALYTFSTPLVLEEVIGNIYENLDLV